MNAQGPATDPIEVFGVDLAHGPTGDPTVICARLRWPNGLPTTTARRVAPALLTTVRWLDIRQVPRSEDVPRPWMSLIGGLHGAGQESVLLVGKSAAGEPVLSFGVPADQRYIDFTLSAVAPILQLALREQAPEVVEHHLSAVDSELLRVVPRLLANTQSDNPAESLSEFLQNLLALPMAGWSVVCTFEPVHPDRLERQGTFVRRSLRSASSQVSSSIARDEVTSSSITDTDARRAVAWLEAMDAHLERCRQAGGWRTLIQVWAADPVVRNLVAGCITSGIAGHPEQNTTWLTDVLPVAAAADPGTTVFTSSQLERMLAAPAATLGPLVVAAPPPRNRRILKQVARIGLGKWLGSRESADIDVADLVGHGFICGLTGSGKSVTTSRLLIWLWNRYQIPFLVIDPAKADYRDLGGMVTGGMHVVRGRDLRLSALQPWPGTDITTHLGRVASAFRGAFALPSPVPYVLDQIFVRLAESAGSSTDLSLHDVRSELESLMPTLGYRGELEGNIRASLGTRLSVLTAPSRAERVCSPDNGQLAQLLGQPTVIELSDIGDEQESAFLMSLLTIFVAEAASARGTVDGIAHVTAIEEAHRLIPEPGPQTTETGDAAGVGARLMVQMLSEVRSTGESILIVDQSPAAVARAVIRNTNLKIAHRIVDPEDRLTIGGSMGLDPKQAQVLAALEPGQTLISSRRLPQPQAMAVIRMTVNRPPDKPPPTRLPTARLCCSSADARDVRAHHAAEEAGRTAEQSLGFLLVAGGSARLAGPLIDRLQAQAPLAGIRCLVQVGLRRYLRALAGDGYLIEQDVLAGLRRGLHEWVTTQAVVELAGWISADAATKRRPYRGCDGCPAPCLIRPLVIRDSMGLRPGLDNAIRRSRPGSESEAGQQWALGARAWAGQLLTATRAQAFVHCHLVHAARHAGLGDDVTFLGSPH